MQERVEYVWSRFPVFFSMASLLLNKEEDLIKRFFRKFHSYKNHEKFNWKAFNFFTFPLIFYMEKAKAANK